MSAKPRRAPKSKALAPTPPPMETAAGTPGFAEAPQASFHNALTMSTILFEPRPDLVQRLHDTPPISLPEMTRELSPTNPRPRYAVRYSL